MNILNVAVANLFHRPSTQRFPNREAPAAAFRGHVAMDADLCVTCGICSLVCVSAAIEVVPMDGICTWTYDPAACTFCGSCVEHCPVNALTQAADRGPACALPGEQAVTVIVEYPACVECHKPAMPFSEPLLQLALPGAAEELRNRARLCGDCRQKASVAAIKKAFGGPDSTERQADER